MEITVQVEPSGHSFTVREGETVLDAALRQGVALPYGCRNGSCGSCLGKVLEGEVGYRDGRPPGLSDGEAEQGMALFCQARPASALRILAREVDRVEDIAIRRLPCRVTRLERLSHDVIRLFLKLPDTERLQFLAGQYVDILLRDGQRRAFSLANAPHDDRFLELHVRHVEGGTFTDFVFDQMKEKALLRIEGPLGTFVLREASDRPMLFIAGGTGFAPIKGLIEHALAEGVRRPMHLYWGARAKRDLYLHDLAQGWAEQHPQLNYVPVLSEPAANDDWSGVTGLVHEAVLADFTDLSTHDVYTSGPPAMVSAVRETFIARGLDPSHLFSDAFEFAHQTGKA
ncbi:MAG: CDP-6-deoxy-delta-3,4-glucoseen reductase [Gammaproteobacteria bacterium]|nr:CDP-6-deoxy-delta-3,4-glucoseen reductase [Gammaproteobacteria bacterium]